MSPAALQRLTAGLLALVLAGCASAPMIDAPAAQTVEEAAAAGGAGAGSALPLGQQVFDIAALQLGAPYRNGAAGPETFDCSGLVLYAHSRLGIVVPRTAAAQAAAAQPVPLESLRAGDLLFFRMRGDSVDHVGIYDGAGHFLHAPGQGRGIERARFELPWYRGRLVAAGRFWVDAAAATHAR